MPLLADRIQETSTTTGTGTLTLAGAVTGYRSFNASFTNGDVVFYTIDDTLGNWEVGSGTVGTGTLTRATVIVSSNANALVNFGAGAKRVFCSAPTQALLPNQTSNSGKYLTTDGTSPSWSTVTAGTVTSVSGTGTVSGLTLTGTVTSSGSLTLGGTLDLSAYNAAGAFTTLSASSTVSGTGFSTYLASPPAIGGTTPAAGNFTTLGATGNTTLGDAAGDTLTINAGVISIPNGQIATTAASQAEMEAGTEAALRSMSPLRVKQAIVALPGSTYGLFCKADPTIVAFTKTGNFTISTATTLYVEVNGVLKTIASSAAVTMPGSAVAGTDYAIWAKTDGTLEATSNHTSPPTANARKIGGFHYAPGGNAAAQSGGNTTAQINEYSFWDLKFRPACSDPRGMTLVAGGFWCDIYLTGVDAITDGTSKYNVTHADGASPPKVPALFGGNGSTTYGSLTWFEASELARAFGKRPLFQSEFMAAAYGTTEASSVGTDQGSSVLNAAYTSKWGVIQASGVLWVWGQERGGAYSTTGWNDNTEGRGSEYNAPNAAVFGGYWVVGADSGSRASDWGGAASRSNGNIGLRCAADHLLLD